MTETLPTYHWLKQLPRALLQKDQMPLLGFPPEFPWKLFSQEMGKLIEIKDLTISPKQIPEWRNESELFTGLGLNPQMLHFSLAPDGGVISWAMSQNDLKSLMELTLLPTASLSSVFDTEFGESFYQFLAIESLQIISKLDFDSSLSFQMISDPKLPYETSLCIDVSIIAKDKTFWGRLILSPAFHKQWKSRYAERTLHGALDQTLNLILHLEAGRIKVAAEEWKSVRAGDFILVDACSINPASDSNQIKLTIHGLPLFAGEIVEEGIHLLEYAQYQEGDFKMAQDDDLDGSINEDESEFESEAEADEELELNESELEELDDDNFDDLLEIEGDEEFVKDMRETEKWPPPPEKRSDKLKEEEKHADAQPAETVHHVENDESNEQPQTLSDVPLPIIIEVGRIQMSIGKLMELQPGNLLDLKVHPESGVDLVVHGRRIARGELLLLGETLGVRILEIS